MALRAGAAILAAAVLAAVGPARGASIQEVRRVTPGDPTAPILAGTLLEYEVRLDRSYANPFDPRQVRVRASFLRMDGGTAPAATVDGFWFQEFDSRLEGGVEVLEPRGEAAFRVRWRPLQAGFFRVAAEATDDAGTALAETLDVQVSGDVPDPFVRLRRDGIPGFLRDGRPWVPVGYNAGWAGAGGTRDFERWMERLAGGWSRKWMTAFDGTALEWKAGGDGGAYGGPGTYNLKAGWRLDRILALAEAWGVSLQLVLQQHSQFEADHWSSWADNPWNAANGGPCQKSMDFFTDPEVVAGFDRRARYVVARFGHSPAVMAWELWNEVDLVGGYDRQVVAAWSHGRVEALRAADPYGHLVTTSYALPAFQDQDWDYPGYDFAQLHTYIAAYWDALELFAPQLRAFGKPVVVGEFGIDFLGVENLRDGDATMLVNASLLSVMLGYAGGAMSWWWDGWLEAGERYGHVQRLRERLALLAAHDAAEPLEGVRATGGEGVEARGVRTFDGALLWLHDAASEWDRDPATAFAVHGGVRVEAAGLVPPDQACRGTFAHVDAWGDGDLREGLAVQDLPGGGAAFEAPAFTRDLLVRVRCTGGPADEGGGPDGAGGDDGGPGDGAATDDGPGAEVPPGGDPGGTDGAGDDAAGDAGADLPGDGAPAEGDEVPPPRRSGGCSARL